MSSVGQGRQINISWVPAQNGNVPYNAIQADNQLFIARARTENDVTPGKVKTGHPHGFFSYGGKEQIIASYEVLCDTGLKIYGQELNWVYCTNGTVCSSAVVGGHTQNKEPLYIARSRIQGEMTVGKVACSHQCGYFPFGGIEHRLDGYEVLCFVDH